MKNFKELNIKTKIEIACKMQETNLSYRKLAQEYNTSKSSIARIYSKKEFYLNFVDEEELGNIIRLPYTCKTNELIDLIKKDFNILRKKSCVITKRLLKDIAIKRANEIGLTSFQFSNDYYRKIKRILKIKYKTLSGSAMTYNKEAAEEFIFKFPELIQGYETKDVFNCDESCFYIRGQSKKSLVINECTEGKKDTEKISGLMACSMTGEKLPLLFIGRSKTPRCFKRINLTNYDIHYYANKSAFMTSKIFDEYIENINSNFKLQNRKIIMILDNCLAHKLKIYSNIVLLFIPPNTSALIQPLDMGVIKSIKDRYKQKISDFLNYNIDNMNNNIKSIKIIDTILWLNQIWLTLPESLIINCWKKSGLYRENVSKDICNEELEDIISENDSEDSQSNNELIEECEIIEFQECFGNLCSAEIKNLKCLIKNMKDILCTTQPVIYNQVLELENLIQQKIYIPNRKNDIRYLLKKKD